MRQQLLGRTTSANGRFMPLEEDVPLRRWIANNVGESPVAP